MELESDPVAIAEKIDQLAAQDTEREAEMVLEDLGHAGSPLGYEAKRFWRRHFQGAS